MTVQQEAYNRINQMSDDGIRRLLMWIDKSQDNGLRRLGQKPFTVSTASADTVEAANTKDTITKFEIDWENDQNAAKEFNIKHLFELEHEQEQDDEDYVSHKVFENTLDIVLNAIRQPEVFKTYENSMNLQYELEDDSYLEFEVFDNRITCMIVPKRVYDDAYFPEVDMLKDKPNMDVINKIIGEFYEYVA